MDEKKQSTERQVKTRNTNGGMYRGVSVPIKVLNVVILLGVAVLAGVIFYMATSGSGFSITFDTDGGSAVSAQVLKYDAPIERPEDPTKPGYHFAGWYWDREGTKPWEFEKYTVRGNVVLFAKWEKKTIDVSFDLDGGAYEGYGIIEPISIGFNEPYGALPTPQKEGYTFGGWQYDGSAVTETTVMTMNGPHTLKALWNGK